MYNPSIASTESFHCIPCPQGMFNPTAGSEFCYECLATQNCPLGSIEPDAPKL
jgi:hypothetical protein